MAEKKRSEQRGVIIGGAVVIVAVAALLFVMLAVPTIQANKALGEVVEQMEGFSHGDLLVMEDPYLEEVGVIPKEAQAVLEGDRAEEYLAPLLEILNSVSYKTLEKTIVGSWVPSVTVRNAAGQYRLYLRRDAVYVRTRRADTCLR